jgi:hypothetical protein
MMPVMHREKGKQPDEKTTRPEKRKKKKKK